MERTLEITKYQVLEAGTPDGIGGTYPTVNERLKMAGFDLDRPITVLKSLYRAAYIYCQTIDATQENDNR